MDNKYLAFVNVTKTEAEYLESALTTPDFMSEDETFTKTAKFRNGYEMDIKCCGADDDVAWCEAVLFDENGSQVAYTDPSDDFFDEWELEDNGITYIVRVKKEIGEATENNSFNNFVNDLKTDPQIFGEWIDELGYDDFAEFYTDDDDMFGDLEARYIDNPVTRFAAYIQKNGIPFDYEGFARKIIDDGYEVV